MWPRAHASITNDCRRGVADQQRLDALVARDLGQHGGVGRGQQQFAVAVALDRETSVAPDGLADVDRHRRRHGEARPALERGEHVVGVVAGRARVPQPEPGDAVRVDVLGRALELGEDRELVARRLGVRVCDFEQHSPVALHDERTVSHKGQSYSGGWMAADRGLRREARNQDAGRTLTMLDTGSVRSTSAPRSRPRRRPPPSPEASRVSDALGAVGHPHDDDDHRLRAHRLLELAAEPGRIGIRLVSRAQGGDQPRIRVARLDEVRVESAARARRCSDSGAPDASSATTG